jgi:hypothetical protein
LFSKKKKLATFAKSKIEKEKKKKTGLVDWLMP